MQVKYLDSKSAKIADTVYSDFPCLLVENKRVEKTNIAIFLKKLTTINEEFKSVSQRDNLEKIKRLEVMC